MTEIAVYNVYGFLQKIDDLNSVSYFGYWLYLGPPLIFLLAVSALISDNNDTGLKKHFDKRIPIVFGLLTVYILFHMIPAYAFNDSLFYMRLVVATLAFLTAVTKDIRFFYAITVLWVVGLFIRVTYNVT